MPTRRRPAAAATVASAVPAKQGAAASATERAMAKLGLRRPIDFALHLPIRYEDETRLQALATAREGEVVQCEVTVQDCQVVLRPRRQLVAHTRDDAGVQLTLRFLHFYPSQQKQLAQGAKVRVRGELRGGFFGREMVHPVVRAAGTKLPTTLTPVYPTTASLPQPVLRRAIASALAQEPLDECLPPALTAGLPSLRDAVRTLHDPPRDVSLQTMSEQTHPAWQRLKFDELLAQQLSQLSAKAERAKLRAPELRAGGLHAALLKALPFALTAAQQRVVRELAQSLGQPQPMNRLLQGDVGSGKTVVAALAACIAIDSGWQCALMAPTEILAEQHFRKLVSWLEPLGLKVAWLTGSQKSRQRQEALAQVACGEAQLVVGTHAVIQDKVQFARLGLAVVDEQHRFGVAQRLALRAKLSGQQLEPHLLMMSATPIPRTLAMTYFADLDISTIDELPPGRRPIVTKLFSDAKRDALIERVRAEVEGGRQVYWVCPLIEESQELDLRNATATHAALSAAMPERMVGLLHGRMPAAEKAAVMSLFSQGQMPLLVATTVIEVGVDVPQASLMVIEHAERFGLAQLHQLRGRVGRGTAASVCVLLYTPPLSQAGRERLKAMIETQDGFEIARRDLQIRGPGEFMGARQSGDALLRFADLQSDSALLQRARDAAPALLKDHPQAAQAHIDRWLGAKVDYLKA